MSAFPRTCPFSRNLGSRFRPAPLRSRTVGLPESGSDLGITQSAPSPSQRCLNAGPYSPLLRWVYPAERPPRFSGGSVSTARLRPPSAQSPFADRRCYRLSQDVEHPVSGHYPAFFAHTNSCANPKPSHRLRSVPWSVGLCRLLPAPTGRGTFPMLSLPNCPHASGPLPRSPLRCTYPFLPSGLWPFPPCQWFGV